MHNQVNLSKTVGLVTFILLQQSLLNSINAIIIQIQS